MTIAANLRYPFISRTPAGRIDTRYFDGNDGTAALPLGWADVPDILGKVSGVGYSINLRTTYLTEPSPGDATITYDQIGTGWSFDGSTLTLGTGVSNTVMTFTATFAGKSAIFSIIVESIAASSGDTTAPTKVLNVVANQVVNGIQLTFDPAMDPRVASQTETGLKDYQILRDGGASPIATVNAAGVGIPGQFTKLELGGAPAGSLVQTGNSYILTSNGVGIGTGTEYGTGAYVAVTGDFTFSAELHGFTGGDSTALMALMVRESLVGSDRMSLTRVSAAGARTRERSTAGAATSAVGVSAANLVPLFVKYERVGGVLTSSYSVDGNTFTVLRVNSTSYPATMYAFLFAGFGATGSPIIADFRNVCLQNQAQVSYLDTIIDQAVHSYTIKARDIAVNSSAASASVSATAPAGADIIPPTVPGASTAFSNSQSTAGWTFGASTDTNGTGVRGYVCATSTTFGGTYTDQAEQTILSFTVSGLAAATIRWMKVKAIDNAGNVSAYNTAISSTSQAAPPADSTPPTVPSGNSAVGISTIVIRINSSGSTDAVSGVSRYPLYVATSAAGPFNLAPDVITSFPYDYTPGGTAGATRFFKLSARDGASPSNESVQSATFQGATLSSSNIITVTNNSELTAAMAAAIAGQTIRMRTATYTVGIQTGHAGTAAQLITLEADAGQSPVITGSLVVQSNAASVHVLHPYWVIGGGILLQGTNPGTQSGHGSAGLPDRGVIIRASNVQIKFNQLNTKFEWILIPPGVTTTRIRYSDMICDVSGALKSEVLDSAGQIQDTADGTATWSDVSLASYHLIENSKFSRGGHSAAIFLCNNGRITNCVFDGNWTPQYGGVYGQKGIDNYCIRSVIEDTIMMGAGQQFDNPSTSTTVQYAKNGLIRRSFILGTVAFPVVYGLGYNVFKWPGPANSRCAHTVIWNITNSAIQIGETIGSSGEEFPAGPYKFKNCIFANCATTAGSRVLWLDFAASKNGGGAWTTRFFFEKCVFTSNQNVRIFDIEGGTNIVDTIQNLMTNFPANFKNCTIGSPSFVNAAAPSTAGNATTMVNQARANFLAQAVSCQGTAAPLAVTVGSVTGSTTVTVDDALWFDAGMGWSHIPGDTIYFASVGSRQITAITGNVLTLNAPISVGNGVGVFLGSSATPNIGAVLV